MVNLRKKLTTGTVIGAWSYDDEVHTGQSIGVKDTETGIYNALVQVESVKCIEGLVDRIVINKSLLKQFGFVIVEE